LNNSPRDIQMLSVVQNQKIMDKKDSPNHENKIFFFVSPLLILQIDYPQNLKIQKTNDIVHKSFLEQKIHTFCIRPHHTTHFPPFSHHK